MAITHSLARSGWKDENRENNIVHKVKLQMHSSFPSQKALRRELKDKEQTILTAVDQARVFLADQPIEGPEEPRRSLHSKTGQKILSSGEGQKQRERTCMSLIHIFYPSYWLRPQDFLSCILMSFISMFNLKGYFSALSVLTF